MLSQAALESLYSATYVEDYLDGMENLPDDVQRKISQILELNVTLRSLIEELETNMSYLMENLGKIDLATSSAEDKKKKRKYKRVQQILMMTQDIGDEKLQLGQQIQDLMENKVQQLNLDKKNIDLEKKHQDAVETVRETTKAADNEERPIKRARRARHEVFVPSILGPATLEATSFQQMPADMPCTSVSVTVSHPPKSQSLTSRQASPIRVKKEEVEKISSPRPTKEKTEPEVAPVAAAVRPSSAEPLASVVSPRKVSESSKIPASRSLNFSSAAEVSSSTTAAPIPTPTVVLAVKTEIEETQSESSSTQPGGSGKGDLDWRSKSITNPKKDKRGKKRRSSTKQPINIPIDPDEPLYCLCDQVSWGEMIGCDNDLCPIEWFHFACVGLSTKPKGKWFCPKCRGDRSNVMKPKAIFLKELAIYNRQKEESN